MFPSISSLPAGRSRSVTYVLVFMLLLASYPILRGTSWVGSTELHKLMEAVATLLALLVGTLAMLRFYARRNITFRFIGTGFVGTGLLDGYHAIVTSSIFANGFPSAPSPLIPWSWIAWTRQSKPREPGEIGEGMGYLIAGTLTVSSFVFFSFVPLPRAYYSESLFHRPEEFVPALFFLVALIGYLRKGTWRTDDFEHWLVLSLIIGFMGQAMFMSFSGRLFDFEFDAAHLLKKISYIPVLVGLLISIFHLFKQLEPQKVDLQVGMARRRLAEEALKASEERFRRVVEDAADAIFVMDRLVTEGVSRRMRVEVAHDLTAAMDAIARQRPGAVLLDLSIADEWGNSISALAELSEAPRPLLVLAMADTGSFDDRLQVARLGGKDFLQRSSSSAQVLDYVVGMLARIRSMHSKVMAVDDAPLVLAGLTAMLERRGFAVTTLLDPRRFWETLRGYAAQHAGTGRGPARDERHRPVPRGPQRAALEWTAGALPDR